MRSGPPCAARLYSVRSLRALLAEGDRDAYRREQAAVAREKEIMKDVPGWEVRRYCQCSLRLQGHRERRRMRC